ncbi:MAG TPA: nitroreductase family deazaflavin-dependent oxidoreductase [Mycobacteriales bacterium]|nr:nitroreductase family deazaflavin-dependent oxidoreductase [Mycobacteriales bacterium]
MTDADGVIDSPVEWVAEHIHQYDHTDGAQGHLWRDLPTLLLTTRGRRSGAWRRTALIYGRDGGDYLVVASNGGSTTHPLWYLNLSSDPRVRVQVGAERFAANARTAGPEEKPRMWRVMAAIFPSYDEYRTKTSRDIPVVVLTPEPGSRPGS